MELLENIIAISNKILWIYVLIALLIGLGIFFTIRTNFVQFRMVKEMLRLLGQGQKQAGLEPVFHASTLKGVAHISCWPEQEDPPRS